jgi:hypothetical protein
MLKETPSEDDGSINVGDAVRNDLSGEPRALLIASSRIWP